MVMPVSMILLMYVILYILLYDFNKLTILYIHVHISLISPQPWTQQTAIEKDNCISLHGIVKTLNIIDNLAFLSKDTIIHFNKF